MSIGTSPLVASRLAYGCWRVAGAWKPANVTAEGEKQGRQAIMAAYETGYTLFDTADIYTHGVSEKILGAALKEAKGMRENVLIATKCGIRFGGEPNADSPHRYDFSAKHIIRSCDGSLQRMGIETIDLFQLHRPDFLADPAEIAEAFTRLEQAGKVRYFGVSNFRPSLVTALQIACPMSLVVNQVEISLARLEPFTDGTLDQCLFEKITPMAWSPLAGGALGEGSLAEAAKRINAAIDSIARVRGVSRSVIALAWLLKHPSKIMPIVGSTNPQRIREAVKAVDMELSREEWYGLLLAARGEPLP